MLDWIYVAESTHTTEPEKIEPTFHMKAYTATELYKEVISNSLIIELCLNFGTGYQIKLKLIL